MRIYVLLLSICFGISLMSKAQDNHIDTSRQFTIIYLPSYYKEEGVIFSKEYIAGIEMDNLQSRYTPTKDDIIAAEEIFKNKFNDIRQTDIDTKKKFCHWVRQYIGLVDTNGNKNIIVQLVDNTKPRKTNRLLGKNWETVFVVMLSDNFYSISTRLRINIDTGEMSNKL